MGVDREVIKPGDGKLTEVTLYGGVHDTSLLIFTGQGKLGFGSVVEVRFGSAIAKGRYRKNPHMQNSMRKLKLTLTLVLTLTDTGGAVLTLC